MHIAFLYGKRRRFDDVSFSLISVTRYLFLDRYGRRGSNNGVYKVFTDVATGGGGGGGGGRRADREASEGPSERARRVLREVDNGN